LEAKQENTAYNHWFKMAFKDATELIAGMSNSSRGESVPSQSICSQYVDAAYSEYCTELY
jgi:hypothetical protein